MTVLEYDGRIVVVDTGLRFPTAEMLGIDLVLPDFAYLRERAADIEAIVITHGHEDHLGALPWVLREIGAAGGTPPVYAGRLTIAMARSKLDEHKLRDVELEDIDPGEVIEAGPFEFELIHMTHSIPDSCAVAVSTELGTVLLTGDYKFDQTPVDGDPADISAARRARPRGRAAAVRRLDQRRPPRFLALGGACRAGAAGGVRPRRRSDHRHQLRLEHPPRPAGGRRRGRARPEGGAGRPLDAQELRHRPLAGHIEVPDGLLIQPQEIEDFPDEKVVVISTGRQGEPLSALRRMANNDHREVKLHSGDTVVFSATPMPGNERAVNETIDRIYQIGCHGGHRHDAPIHASGHGYVEELKLMLNLTKPRYVMPVHGDHKRMRLHAELADSVGSTPSTSSRAATALPLEIDASGARFGEDVQAGMIFVDGVDIGDPDDVALRDRRRSRPTASSSSSPRSPRRTAARRRPGGDLPRRAFLDEADALVEELRDVVEGSLEDAAARGHARDRPDPGRPARRRRQVRLRAAAPPADGAAGGRRGLSGKKAAGVAGGRCPAAVEPAGVVLASPRRARVSRPRERPEAGLAPRAWCPERRRGGSEAAPPIRCVDSTRRVESATARTIARPRPVPGPPRVAGRRGRSGRRLLRAAPAGSRGRRRRPRARRCLADRAQTRSIVVPAGCGWSALSSRLSDHPVQLVAGCRRPIARLVVDAAARGAPPPARPRPRRCQRSRRGRRRRGCWRARRRRGRAAAGRRPGGSSAARSAAPTSRGLRPARRRAPRSSSRLASTLVSGVRSSCEASATNSRWRSIAASRSARAASSERSISSRVRASSAISSSASGWGMCGTGRGCARSRGRRRSARRSARIARLATSSPASSASRVPPSTPSSEEAARVARSSRRLSSLRA